MREHRRSSENGEFITVQHLPSDIARARPRVDRTPNQAVALDGHSLKDRVEQLEATGHD